MTEETKIINLSERLSNLSEFQAEIPAVYKFKYIIVASMKKLGFQCKLADNLKAKVIDDPNFFTIVNILNFAMSEEKVELRVSKLSSINHETIYNIFESIWINSLKEIFMNLENKSFFEYIASSYYKELMDLFKQCPDMINNVIKNAFPVLDISPLDTYSAMKPDWNYYEFIIQLY